MRQTLLILFSLIFIPTANAEGLKCDTVLELIGFSTKMGFQSSEDYLNWVQGRSTLPSGAVAQPFYSTSAFLGEFSNFARFPVMIENRLYMTSEHYFQSKKFIGHDDEEQVRLGGSPAEIAKMARDRSRPLRKDWEEVKDDIMRIAVEAKFYQHPILAELLLSTGDKILIEHTENDKQWGDAGDGTGYNKLGQILMEIREKLRASKGTLKALTETPKTFLDYFDAKESAEIKKILKIKDEPSTTDPNSFDSIYYFEQAELAAFRQYLNEGMSFEEIEASMEPEMAKVLRKQLGLEKPLYDVDPRSPLLSRMQVGHAASLVNPEKALRLPMFLPGQRFVYADSPNEFVKWAIGFAQNLSRPILSASYWERIVYEIIMASTFHDISEAQFKQIEQAIVQAANKFPTYQGMDDVVLVEALKGLRYELWGRKGFKSSFGSEYFVGTK